jgi:hypothetical protein
MNCPGKLDVDIVLTFYKVNVSKGIKYKRLAGLYHTALGVKPKEMNLTMKVLTKAA